MTGHATALGHHLAGRFVEAERHYRAALAENPDDAEATLLLGTLLHQTGRGADGLAMLGRAVTLAPGDPRVFHNMGEAMRGLRRFADAASCFRLALALDGGPDSNVGLGAALAEDGRLDEAIVALRAALQRAPDHPRGLTNLALALLQSGEVAASLPLFDRAHAAAPEDPLLAWNRALALLLVGDFAAGLPLLENRWRLAGFPSPPRALPMPAWDGAPLAGRTILLHAEQGLGDSLFLLRYLPMVAAEGVVRLAVQRPLLSLLARQPTLAGLIEMLVDEAGPTPPADLHAPLMSLPGLFATRPDRIPAPLPLVAPADRVARWRAAFAALPGRKVGLIARGNPAFAADPRRSIPPAALAPLVGLAGISWVSLQPDAPPPFAMLDAGPELVDFAETAAAMTALDLVLSVDTAGAHLAGSLGRPLWIALPHPPDWRWFLDRGDSPWYPGARLFRQPAVGDWASVVQAIVDALADSQP